jgi:hypothetical protein
MLKETKKNELKRVAEGTVIEVGDDFVILEKEDKDGLHTTKLTFKTLFEELQDKEIKIAITQSDKTEKVVDE